MSVISNIYQNTLILTKKGYFPVDLLAKEKSIDIWDGNNWKCCYIKKNRVTKSKSYTIEFSDGTVFKCMHNQEITILKNIHTNKLVKSEIKNITAGSLLSLYHFPTIDGNEEYNVLYPYTHGFYTGHKNKLNSNIIMEVKNLIYINLDEEINKLQNTIDYFGRAKYSKNTKITTLLLNPDFEKNKSCPINGTVQNKLSWITGIIDVLGFITQRKDARYLNISVLTYEFGIQIKYLCNTLGMNPSISSNKYSRRVMSSNGSNEEVNNNYILTFDSNDTNKLFLEYQIHTHILDYDIDEPNLDQDIARYISIKKIIPGDINNLNAYDIINCTQCIISGILI